MFAFHDSCGPVDLAFTDRHGGVSGVPWGGLNLSSATGDDPAVVAENWRLLLDRFAPQARGFADMHQVHGAEVAVVDAPNAGAGPRCDALVTRTPGVVLAVRAADCVPVLLADPERGVVGAAHAGRAGVESGVVAATVDAMRALGAEAIRAWVGPHVCGGCYEVPAELQQRVAAVEPATRATTTWGTPSLALGDGVVAQLRRHDVEVVDVARCTRESEDLYSHRRDGVGAGRHAGVIMLTQKEAGR